MNEDFNNYNGEIEEPSASEQFQNQVSSGFSDGFKGNNKNSQADTSNTKDIIVESKRKNNEDLLNQQRAQSLEAYRDNNRSVQTPERSQKQQANRPRGTNSYDKDEAKNIGNRTRDSRQRHGTGRRSPGLDNDDKDDFSRGVRGSSRDNKDGVKDKGDSSRTSGASKSGKATEGVNKTGKAAERAKNTAQATKTAQNTAQAAKVAQATKSVAMWKVYLIIIAAIVALIILFMFISMFSVGATFEGLDSNSTEEDLAELGKNYESNREKYFDNVTKYSNMSPEQLKTYRKYDGDCGGISDEEEKKNCEESVKAADNSENLYYLTIYGNNWNSENKIPYNCGYKLKYNGQEIIANNLKVRLHYGNAANNNNAPIKGEPLVDFETYIMGVVMGEVSATASEEVIKTQAIAARSVILYKAYHGGFGVTVEKNGMSYILNVRNSEDHQVYCDPEVGCYNCSEIGTVISARDNVDLEGNSCANYGTYHTLFNPKENEEAIKELKETVMSVKGKYTAKEDGTYFQTWYFDNEQTIWTTKANEGKTYETILKETYEPYKADNGMFSKIETASCSGIATKGTVLNFDGVSYAYPLPKTITFVSSCMSSSRTIASLGIEDEAHNGIDLPANEGTAIYAAMDGTIISRGVAGSGGNSIYIDHGEVNGKKLVTIYHHMVRYGNYFVGDKVLAGDVIGYVGSTGVSSGNHLHFGLKADGKFTEPVDFLYTALYGVAPDSTYTCKKGNL